MAISESTGKEHKVYEGEDPYIFISYSRKDLEKIDPLFDALDEKGYRYWYDEGGIGPGEEWWEKIKAKIRGCRVFVSFLSKNFLDSRYCGEEAEVAYKAATGSTEEKSNIFTSHILRLFTLKYIQWSYHLTSNQAEEVLATLPSLVQKMYSIQRIVPVHFEEGIVSDDDNYPTCFLRYQKFKWDGCENFINWIIHDDVFRPCKKSGKGDDVSDIRIKHTQDVGQADSGLKEINDDLNVALESWTNDRRSSSPIDSMYEIASSIYPMDMIGYGRHSVVYKGILETSGRLVVIKEDERDLAKEYPDLNAKFEALQSIRHPYIAEFISAVADPVWHRYSIIMEYVPGKSVRQTLEDEKAPVRQGLALDWGCQILDALAYLHEKGRIHGRVQAENIILTPIQDKERRRHEVRLIDYSVGVPWQDDNWQDDKEIVHDVFGEASPEKFQKGVQVDLYGVGKVLFLLLTDSDLDDLEDGVDKEAALEACGVTEPVREIVCKAIDGNYGSAEKVLSDLRSLPLNDQRERYISLLGIGAAIVSLAVLFLGFGLYVKGNSYLLQQFATGVPQAMDGEILIMIGRVFMVLFPVVSVASMLWWRRFRDRWKDALLRDYGEEIYNSSRLISVADRAEKIFSDVSKREDRSW